MSEILLDYPHKKQIEILQNRKRFNHVRCGRRFGKTSLIEYLVSPAVEEGFIGIWFPTYKDLSEVWKHVKHRYNEAIEAKDEQLKQIRFIGGGLIDFWSMDDPDAGRGRKYHRAIIDEAAKAKKFRDAWKDTIRPTLSDYQGDSFIFSTPKGKANYFYQLEKDMCKFNNWAFFHFTTYDNPYILNSEIQEAKDQLDTDSFNQEYLAQYVDLNDKPFMYNYHDDKHMGVRELNPHLPYWFSHDFNVGNMTAGIAQRIDKNTLYVFDEIDLSNADTYEMGEYIKTNYPDIYTASNFTGDASGSNRQQGNRGAKSNWQILRAILKIKDSKLQVRSKNLKIEDSYSLCNSVMQHANIIINPKCKNLLEDLREARIEIKLMENGDSKMILIKDEIHGLHHLDWFRYLIDANFPDFIKNYKKYY